ncbi:hypothetical protein QJQ45_011461 [Haematococcus lacustris]|nr:hypothetical protein QJQ45_011461 [Haematococcus lacustris]
MAARMCDDPLTLHHRLGHPGYRQLARLTREGMVTGTSVKAAHCEAAADNGNLCEPCVLAKQHRLVAVQHQGLGGAVKHPLELVHSDVCDISGHADAAVPAPSGMRYFVTVLNEYNSLVAVMLIKHKSDAPAAITDMLTQLQRQTGRRVVALRSDRGGEYMGAEMQQWLRAQGITHQQTAPYSPEMNGSAERINRTLMACARAIVFASGAPKHLCGEAIRAAAHLHNISPVAEKPCTPFEAAFGSKPDIAHLRVWGCPAYVHDPAPDGKLASRSIKGLFVGYEPGGKAYRVWAEGRIHVSKSVVFDEQAVLRRYAPASVSGPAALAAPPEGEASRGGAMSRPDAEDWGRAMDAEIASQLANETWQLVDRQIDFKTAFLNSKLTDADPLIFVEQPEGYEVGKGQVCQLLKTVHGLKQAPRAWYLCLRQQLEQIGFKASAADPSLFSMHSSSGSMVHMLVYVDDCILASSDTAVVQAVKQQLQQAFEVHDLGPARDFLGMRITYDRATRTLQLNQQQYIEQLLQRFGKAECKMLAPSCDFASDRVSYRSTTGYVFVLSAAAVSWRSKLQTTVAASTTEAEYQAAADATKEALFLRKLLHELQDGGGGPVPIRCDSQGAVALLKNPVESQRSKHIAIMHHMARERVWRGEVLFTYCPTADMVADALTKALSGQKFGKCKEGMGVG